jgi:hypothetical protein
VPKLTIHDPKTGEPILTMEGDMSIKKLILQAEEALGIKFGEKLRAMRTERNETEIERAFESENSQISRLTRMDKVKLVLSQLLIGWHTTTEIKESFEREFNEGVELATIATYMARLVEQGILERRKVGKGFEYRVENKEKLKQSFSDEILFLLED